MTPKKFFTRWLTYQTFPRHWDGWEAGTVERLMHKAFEAGRKFQKNESQNGLTAAKKEVNLESW